MREGEQDRGRAGRRESRMEGEQDKQRTGWRESRMEGKEREGMESI